MIDEASTRIGKAEKVIAKLSVSAPGSNKLHQKKRRLATLKARLASMKSDQEAGVVRLCFGSRRLFRAQFDLAANGYADHAEWKRDWQAARGDQFFVLGSQDETAGNQTCQARIQEDGALCLRLRLPNVLGGTTLEIGNVRFAHGQEQIVAALGRSERIQSISKNGKPIVKRIGSCVTPKTGVSLPVWRRRPSMQQLHCRLAPSASTSMPITWPCPRQTGSATG